MAGLWTFLRALSSAGIRLYVVVAPVFSRLPVSLLLPLTAGCLAGSSRAACFLVRITSPSMVTHSACRLSDLSAVRLAVPASCWLRSYLCPLSFRTRRLLGLPSAYARPLSTRSIQSLSLLSVSACTACGIEHTVFHGPALSPEPSART